jgi:hypothetical protein
MSARCSRKIDCNAEAALERSGWVKEPEETTESIVFEADDSSDLLFESWFVWHLNVIFPSE